MFEHEMLSETWVLECWMLSVECVECWMSLNAWMILFWSASKVSNFEVHECWMLKESECLNIECWMNFLRESECLNVSCSGVRRKCRILKCFLRESECLNVECWMNFLRESECLNESCSAVCRICRILKCVNAECWKSLNVSWLWSASS